MANPIERPVRAVDAWQQRHPVVAFPLAVVRKFGDDQAGNLVALLTHFAFLATFPLLLVLVSVLGILLRGDPHLRDRILNTAFAQFPIIGDTLRNDLHPLSRSGPGLVIGLVGTFLGGRGLANAAQTTLNTVWAVPQKDRPGFPSNLLRSIGLLLVLGLGALLTTGVGTLSSVGGTLAIPVRVLALVASAAVNSGLFLLAFRLATAKCVPTRQLVLGAVFAGLAWQALLSGGTLVVRHYLAHAQSVYGFFGIVLGLLAWFGLQATVTVYAIEADVVRAQQLWPRSITQPPLTGGDKRFYTARTVAEVRRPEQEVTVGYSAAADAPPGATQAEAAAEVDSAASAGDADPAAADRKPDPAAGDRTPDPAAAARPADRAAGRRAAEPEPTGPPSADATATRRRA